MLITGVDNPIEERWRTEPGTTFKTWRIPHCPFPIEYSSAVLDQIRQEVEGSFNSRRGERETGGVLFGTHETGRICILTCKPLPCEHAMGPGFVLSDKDQQRLADLIAAPCTDPKLNGLEALGWYHSHIRSTIFLSKRDLEIHSRHFPALFQIALVLRPSSEGATRAGFFFREPTGAMRTESSYEEFTIESPRPEPELPQPASPAAVPSHRRSSSAPKPPQPHPLACPRCGSRHIRRSHRVNGFERLRGLLGYRPYRCHECLSRSFLKTTDLRELIRPTSRKRPEERRRAWLRTRREMLLWGCGILGFLLILLYLIRDTGPKPDQP